MKIFKVWAVAIAALLVLEVSVNAQSLLSGDIVGTVTDATRGVIAGASIDLKNVGTGLSQSATTDSDGAYRFSLVRPGIYAITAKHAGFKPAEKNDISVSVGKIATADIQLAVGDAASTTVDVTANRDVLSNAPNGSTTFNALEVDVLPSPGGDITNIALTAAGIVMNTQGGGTGGNFSMNGLPGTSNLFTVNGENSMDPYFNISTSGATNLALGSNEVQEATVLASPYGGEYGQLSGAQVILTTKSGSNEFHGNLVYWWNGRAMNSNQWFNNYYGTPKPFSNANQWAASIGGRIIRNRTFFFVDDEGLRFVVPSSTTAVIPTQAFANAVLANVTKLHPAEAPAYKTMLGLLTNAPGASSARDLPSADDAACSSISLPGFNPATTACSAQYEANAVALASESVLAFRVDHKLTNSDNLFYRYKADRGTQPSAIDVINSNFNALSKQPQWDNQLSETHVFSPNSTNQFLASFSHYVAQFAQDPQKVAGTFPYGVFTSTTVPYGALISGVGAVGFNAQGIFPQGRNITQYQFIDDYTYVKGKHTLKFGENFRRYDVSDHSFFYENPQVYFGTTDDGLQKFANGLAYQYRRSKNISSNVPIALWGIGMYAHDDWRIKPNLTITLGVRAEHNSNPVCQTNCFANFKAPFNSLPSVTTSTPGSVPYSADISFGQHQAYQGVDAINWLPSIGIRWSPSGDARTVISGGFGLFFDNAASVLANDLLGNPPSSVSLRVRPAGGVLPFDPGPDGAEATFRASANAFNINKTPSQISTELKALGSVFTPPTINSVQGTVHSPRVAQWNFQVQRQFGDSTALVINYAGNRSDKLIYENRWSNAYDLFGIYPGILPATAPNPGYGIVNQIQSGAKANYNGLQITVRKQLTRGISGHFNYTWSHTLDNVSNGGLQGFGAADSLLDQLVPGSLVRNYGDADYDIRHTISADFVYAPKFSGSNAIVNKLANGWQLGSKITYHTGTPFSVEDGNTAVGNGPATLLAIPTGNAGIGGAGCGKAAVDTPCLLTTGFIDGASLSAYPGFSFQNRNQFRGPGFFGLDTSLFRNFRIRERATFGLGMTAYNLLNHPNFANPVHAYGDTNFGKITAMESQPNSAYGNGLGFDSSVRVIQLTGKVTF